MLFNSEGSKLQQRMAASSAGVHRRQEILHSLEVRGGQTILDIGCGGGHLLENLSLAVGESGKVYGLDPSKAQLDAARDRCSSFNNIEFLCHPANKTTLKENVLDLATSTQTLEYIEDVESSLIEIARVLKRQSKFVNVSVLWEHFKFYGPEAHLNELIHDSFRAHCHHQMLPMELKMLLSRVGFGQIKSRGLAFLVTERNENSPAKFSEEVLARFALSQGVSEDKVQDWRKQLSDAENEGRFGFTSFPVITEGRLS